jgi:4-diphosphocytidyl-2-C-methyl-D-erythritol kinase
VLDNGYHLLDSIVAPINLYDDITIIIGSGSKLEVECEISPGKDNLAWKAAKAFLENINKELRIHIKISKRIPSGAGLGGGSSDAACVLTALNRMLECNLAMDELKNIAKGLGSDVPCFIHQGWRRMTGTGDIVEDIDAPAKHIVLALPDKPVPTTLSYKEFDKDPTFTHPIKNRLDNPYNNLQKASIIIVPEIAKTLELLSISGAHSTCMTGSGSACFGVYENKKQADAACLELESKVRALSLIAGF